MRQTIWTKDFIYAIFVLFCVHTGPYLLLSVITIYGKMLSGSDTLAGMMASVFALSGLFARFLSAFLLDKFGAKKILIIFTALMTIASFLYIFTSQYWQAFMLRGIQGLAYGVTCTAMSTYIVNLLDPQNRLEGIGYSSLTANLANALGPTVAYILLGPKVDQFKTLFIVVFISVVISLFAMIPVKDARKTSVVSDKIVKPESLNLSDVFFPFLLWAFMSLAMSSVAAFLSLSSLEKGFSNIGLYFTFNVIGLVFSRFVMKYLTDTFGQIKMICSMIVVIALCLTGISLTNAIWQLYLIALPFGFANGCLAPLINTMLVNQLPSSKSGLANAAFFAAGDAGFIIGPAFWGMVAGFTSYNTVFIISSAVCLCALLLQLIQSKIMKGAD
ncbi:MAG: MFS transporter [Solobacterium sp.]|nr:MFS transporter [Solobacterium sp.]